MTTTEPERTQTVDLLEDIPTDLLIGGQWVPGGSNARFDVRNPASGAVLTDVADATPEDSLRALNAAAAAQDSWAATPPRVRSEILRRSWELLQAHREQLALLMTLEMGKPLGEARGEVTYGSEFFRWFSEEAVRVSGRHGSNPEATGTTIVTYRPVGPCYLVTPWNFPLAMATRKIAPALAAGCTVVIKPAELTPLTTLYLGRLLIEAGVPDGVVNIVPTTDSPSQSAAVMADPRLRKLSFTGSTPVGRTLLRQAADGVLRTSMELGGNAPFLVFEDADLDIAVDGAMLAKFRNIGQACTAANRFIVHESVADDFARRVAARVAALRTGDGSLPGTDIGPLIDERAVAHNAALVQDAINGGARLLTGGTRIDGPGTFFSPTVLTDLGRDARILTEEIFGPVLGIVTFADEAEAVHLANATEYGLAAYAFTNDLGRANRLIARLDSGMVGINTGLVSNASAPFGGVKASGLGREGGSEGIAEYLETCYALVAV